jgi:hypothetical protein
MHIILKFYHFPQYHSANVYEKKHHDIYQLVYLSA